MNHSTISTQKTSYASIGALRAEIERRVHAGHQDVASSILDELPEHLKDDETALELICTEFIAVESANQRPEPADFVRRFPTLADRLERLFQVHEAMGPGGEEGSASSVDVALFWETPRHVADPSDTPLTVDAIAGERIAVTQPPRVIGRYEILEEIGHGGMGVVFKARQSGLGRIVALKILRWALASEDELMRFQREAETAARLEHPNIAAIHEIGLDGDTPYISMEYVAGGSLADTLASGPLAIDDAAEKAEALARTVHFAHKQGVVHRDLKPANVLFTLDGALKIVDFGLAKQLWRDDPLGQVQSLTRTDQIIGTPCYMAPEQAAGAARDAGPPADIYAVGAILYEMLTGVPPFRADAPVATLEQIQNEVPVSPRRLRLQLPRDLETIVLKCLEKSPGGRYSNAAEMAADVERFREGRPIAARPISATARGWRWCRRKPAVAGLAATLGLVTVVGFAVMFSLWQRSEQLRVTAETNETTAKTNATIAQSRLEEAQQNLALAEKTVEQYVQDVSDDLRLRKEDLHPLRMQLLEQAVPFYENLVDRYSEDPKMRLGKAKAHLKLATVVSKIGSEDRAIEQFESAVRAFDGLIESGHDDGETRFLLGRSLRETAAAYQLTGRFDQARSLYDRSIDVLEKLSEEEPTNTQVRYDLGQSYNDRGAMRIRQEQLDEAVADFDRATEIQQSIVDDEPDNRQFLHDLMISYGNLGSNAVNQRQLPVAEDQLQKALDLGKELLQLDSQNLSLQFDHARFHSDLGVTFMLQRQYDRSDPLYREAIHIASKLADLQPSVTEYREFLATAQLNFGSTLRGRGRLAEALDLLVPAQASAVQLVEEHPAKFGHQRLFGMISMVLGDAYLEKGDPTTAEQSLQSAIDVFDRLAAQHPEILGFQKDQLGLQQKLAGVFASQSKHDEAVSTLQEIAKNCERLSAGDPKALFWKAQFAGAHNSIGNVLFNAQNYKESRRHFERARDAMQQANRTFPKEWVVQNHLALAYFGIGRNSLAEGDALAAVDWQDNALASIKPDLERPDSRFHLTLIHSERALALSKTGEYRRSLADWERAIELHDGGSQNFFRARRCVVLALSGDHTEAAKTVAEQTAPTDLPAKPLYHFACAMSQAVGAVDHDTRLDEPQKQALARRYAATGISLLTRAQQQGFFDDRERIDDLVADDDFQPIVDRADFQALVASMRE